MTTPAERHSIRNYDWSPTSTPVMVHEDAEFQRKFKVSAYRANKKILDRLAQRPVDDSFTRKVFKDYDFSLVRSVVTPTTLLGAGLAGCTVAATSAGLADSKTVDSLFFGTVAAGLVGSSLALYEYSKTPQRRVRDEFNETLKSFCKNEEQLLTKLDRALELECEFNSLARESNTEESNASLFDHHNTLLISYREKLQTLRTNSRNIDQLLQTKEMTKITSSTLLRRDKEHSCITRQILATETALSVFNHQSTNSKAKKSILESKLKGLQSELLATKAALKVAEDSHQRQLATVDLAEQSLTTSERIRYKRVVDPLEKLEEFAREMKTFVGEYRKNRHLEREMLNSARKDIAVNHSEETIRSLKLAYEVALDSAAEGLPQVPEKPYFDLEQRLADLRSD